MDNSTSTLINNLKSEIMCCIATVIILILLIIIKIIKKLFNRIITPTSSGYASCDLKKPTNQNKSN